MKNCLPIALTAVALLSASMTFNSSLAADEKGEKGEAPRVIDAGPLGGPPSDAIVLFGGRDLSGWLGGEKWKIENGIATVTGGNIETRQAFGDCQLHVEWSAPEIVKGDGQGRGNSGIKLQGRYEVQVLDSFENVTYFDGQAGSVYKQHPPLVNASRKPGEWQAYDIIYQTARWDADGTLVSPGRVTVLHNGVLVQNHSEIKGITGTGRGYERHAEKAPLLLQFHGNPVRYRNIWIRELN